MLCALLMFAGDRGLVEELFWPERASLGYSWIVTYFLIAAAARFFSHALKVSRASLWVRAVHRMTFWASLLLAPAPLLGWHTESMHLALWLAVIMLVSGAGRAVWLQWRTPGWDAGLLFIASIALMAGGALTSLMLVGVLPARFPYFYSLELGMVVTLAALQCLWFRRMRAIERGYELAREDAAASRLRAGWERGRRDEQQRFMAMLTHELKTPLSLIKLYLSAVSPSARSRQRAELAVRDADTIIERCALASRLEDQGVETRARWCDLTELIEQLLAEQPDGHRVSVRCPGAQAMPTVHSDPFLLRVILSNLIDNALKYSPAGSRVCLTLAVDDTEALHISVANSLGPVTEPDPERVFDKYYRGRAAGRVSGSGLGLHIVAQLVSRLGGSIRCDAAALARGEVRFELKLRTVS